MTGPPTPPPTSAVELQDQARSIARESSNTAQLASSETGTRPEIYQSALPAIIETIQRNDYVGLVKVTERVDISVNMDFLYDYFFFGLINSKDKRRQPSIKVVHRRTSRTRPFGAR